MSDDFAEPTLLRRNSSTTYKEAFEVIKPYHNNLPGGYLTLNKGDIVIVETDQSVAGSSLRFGYKVPYNHQNCRGWFHESCLKKCNIPIENLEGTRYLLSTTPLNSTIDLSTSSAASDMEETKAASNNLVGALVDVTGTTEDEYNQKIKQLENQLHKANAALGERDVQLDAAKKALEKANSKIQGWNNHYKNAPVETDLKLR